MDYYALVSGGFAVVQPNSQLSINAVEGYPLEEFSSDVGNPSSCSRSFLYADRGFRYRLSGLRLLRPRRLPVAAAASRISLRPRLSWRYVLVDAALTSVY